MGRKWIGSFVVIISLIVPQFVHAKIKVSDTSAESAQIEKPIETVTAPDPADVTSKDQIKKEPLVDNREGGENSTLSQSGSTQIPNFSPAQVNVDPQSGSSSVGIPIVVPSGRGGIQPSLSLNYNSNLKQGILGVGWMLDVGSIQVSTKKGVPSYTSADSFSLMQNGSPQELVYDDDAAAGYYRPEQEGSFSKIKHIIEQTSNYWLITDRKGVKYYFGQTNSSREFDIYDNDQSKIFKWNLDRVEDIVGNYMTVSYFRDGNVLYPLQILYTGNSMQGLPTFAKVDFILDVQNRPDPHFTYISKFKRTTQKRVKEIKVSAENNLQWKYVVSYSISPETKKSLVSSIIQYGADEKTSLPVTTFTYQSGRGFTLDNSLRFYGPQFVKTDGSRYIDLGVRNEDLNGDGFADVIQRWAKCDDSDYTRALFQNDQGNGWVPSTDWTVPTSINFFMRQCDEGGTGFDSDQGVRTVDLNADGYVDFVEYKKNLDGSYINQVYLNNKVNSWDYSSWGMPSEIEIVKAVTSKYNEFRGSVFADVNADGFVDYVRSLITDTESSHETFLNNLRNDRTGWARDSSWDLPNDGHTNMAGAARLIDINGDSLPDIVYRVGNGDKRVYFNNGSNWVEDNSSGYYTTFDVATLNDGHTQFADLNGDGLVDYMYTGNVGSHIVTVVINTGNGWETQDNWTPGWNDFDGDFSNGGTRVIDVNGDGLADLMKYQDASPKFYKNTGKTPDLMLTVDNGIGGLTSISYDRSTKYSNKFLPFVLQVVTRIDYTNGIGDTLITKYDYADGYWSPDKREFRGFGKVKTIDVDGNYSETIFAQDDVYKGRPLSQASYDAAGHLYTKSENSYQSSVVSPGVNFIYQTRTDNYVYDGDSTGHRTAQQFFYEEVPQVGNLTKTIQLGEVDLKTGNDIPGDSRSVETEYLNNPTGSNYLLGLPKHTIAKDNNGSIVRQSWLYYDGHTDNNALPIQGFVTKKESWAGVGSINPTAKYTYDSYGNVMTTVDPMGNISTVAYDNTYHLFPLKTTNTLTHSVESEYYGINGVALDDGAGYKGMWGQIKSTTDPNDQKGVRVYDALGRVYKTISPMDSIDYPTTITEYELTTRFAKVKSKSRLISGAPGTVDSTQFYDGFGRLMQTKTNSETEGIFIVSGQVSFNTKGQVEKQYHPVFTTSPLDLFNTVDGSVKHTTLAYDAMGRVIRSTGADGTYSTVGYDDWTTTTTDENGHMQKSYSDPYGRLIKKEEYFGADGRSPFYPDTHEYTLYATTQYAYDSEGNLTAVTDAHGNVSTITYDDLGRKVSMNDPDMGVWSYEYDLNGNLSAQVDAKSQRVEFTYDALNRLINKTDHALLNVSYSYDAGSSSSKQPKNPLQINTEGIMNFSKGRLIHADYNSGDKTQFFYDQIGREHESIKRIDGKDYSVLRSYDALNRLASVQYPDQKQLYYSYGRGGQIEVVADYPVQLWDPNEDETPTYLGSARSQFKFNDNASNTAVLNNGVFQANAIATTNTSNLSQSGKINSSFKFNGIDQNVDIGSSLSDIKHDQTGSFSVWVNVSVTAPGSVIALSSSDYDSNFQLRADPNGSGVVSIQGFDGTGPRRYLIATYGGLFDADQWIHIAVVQDGSALKIYKNGILQTVSSYLSQDDKGAWFGDISQHGEGYLTTANVGRMCGMDGWCGNYLNGKVDDVRYYNFALDQNGVNALYNKGNGTEEQNPVVENQQGAAPLNGDGTQNIYISNIDYNEFGQITRIEYGNGTVTTYDYDLNNRRLTRLLTLAPSPLGSLQDLQYTYDSAGNILNIIDGVNTATQSFSYDALNRLSSATSATNSYDVKTYVYDEIGNIIQKDGLTYSYGTRPHAVTSLSDGTVFSYDANGNMSQMQEVSGQKSEYIYDVENRLTSVKKNNQLIAEYQYDGDGGRTKKTAYTYPGGGGDGEKWKFPLQLGKTYLPFDLHDFVNYITNGTDKLFGITEAEAQVVTPITTTFIGSLYETSTAQLATSHIFLGGTRVASLDNTGKLMFFHGDHLGGTNVTTDGYGDREEVIEYEPFGQMSKHDKYGDGASTANYYFTGKRLDDETGLIDFGARLYNPRIGKFITPDTIVQAPQNPQTLNRYSYTSNNPINRTDPSGHSWKKFWKKWGDFISPLGRAIVTGDWKNFGMQLLNIATIAIGIATLNPWMVASGALSYASRATSHIGDNASDEISRALGYAATAAAVVGTGIEINKAFHVTERIGNLKDGYGFKTNLKVIEKLYNDGRYQEAIDFTVKSYGIDSAKGAVYDPNMPLGTGGETDPSGGIRIGREAFLKPYEGIGSFDASRLPGTLYHEGVHAAQFKSGIPFAHLDSSAGYHLLSRAGFETQAYNLTIANALKLDLSKPVINYYVNQSRYYNDFQYLYKFDYNFAETIH